MGDQEHLQLSVALETKLPDVLDASAAASGWELSPEQPLTADSGVLVAGRHSCVRCLEGFKEIFSAELLACHGLACLSAVRHAFLSGLTSCSLLACKALGRQCGEHCQDL